MISAGGLYSFYSYTHNTRAFPRHPHHYQIIVNHHYAKRLWNALLRYRFQYFIGDCYKARSYIGAVDVFLIFAVIFSTLQVYCTYTHRCDAINRFHCLMYVKYLRKLECFTDIAVVNIYFEYTYWLGKMIQNNLGTYRYVLPTSPLFIC